MKKIACLLLVAVMMLSLAACGSKASTSGGPFTPSQEVNWIVTSKAGGGSDIYTRKMIEIMNRDGISDANYVVDYMTDGGGESGRQYVAKAKKGDELLVAMEFGGFANMLKNTAIRMDEYRCIAVVGEECQILLATPSCKYESIEAAIEAAKAGAVVSISGSGEADSMMYELLREQFGLSDAQLTYIRCSSTSEAITNCMGGHCDYVFARASACISYVESGDLTPVVALQEQRFTGILDCPTIGELGYDNVKVPLWRGVCAPKSCSDEAYAYYCDVFSQMAQSDAWKTEYCEVYQAVPFALVGDEATEYMVNAQNEYLAKLGR